MDDDRGPVPNVSTSRRRRATGVLAVGTSAVAWWPAFTLGAWGIVFFEQLMLLWAVATAAFIVLVVAGKQESVSRLRLSALLVPTAWLVLAFVNRTGQESALGDVARVIGTVITILGIPAMAVLILRVSSPTADDVRDGRDRFAAGLAVLVVVVGAYGAGVWNERFLTCDDFVVSGNSAPPGCNPGTPTLGTSTDP